MAKFGIAQTVQKTALVQESLWRGEAMISEFELGSHAASTPKHKEQNYG